MENEPKWHRAQVIANYIVAFFAACTVWLGYQQYRVLRETNRPSLITGFNAAKEVFPQAGQKLRTGLILSNTGKTVAVAYVRSTISYSVERKDAPSLPETESRVLVWPGATVSEPIEGTGELTEGQISDMKNGQGYIYIRAHVRYGQDNQYHAAICTEQKLKAFPGGPLPFTWEAVGICKAPESNSAN